MDFGEGLGLGVGAVAGPMGLMTDGLVLGADALSDNDNEQDTTGFEQPYQPPVIPPAALALLASGDIGAQAAALVVQSGLEQKAIARQERDIESRIEDHAEKREVTNMRRQADNAEKAAFVEGGAEIGSAACGSPAGAAAVAGAGKIGAGYFSAKAENDAANAKAAEHAAKHASRGVDDAIESDKDARKLIDAALDFYQQYSSTKAQTRLAALHRA